MAIYLKITNPTEVVKKKTSKWLTDITPERIDRKLVEDEVKSLLGTIDDTLLVNLMKSVINGNSEEAFSILSELEELTPEYDILLKDLIGIIHKVSLEQALNNSEDNRIKEIAEMIDREFCQLLYEIAINSYSKFSVHRILAGNNILIVENLANLNKIKSNSFHLITSPLKLKNATGSPIRAMAFID